MANLKELRTRIASVKNTKQMTSAMKMVAAAKLRKAQQAIVQLRPYADKIHHMLSDLLIAARGDVDNPFFVQRDVKNVLLIIVTSNRGLCGGFNTNVEKMAVATIEEYAKKGINANNINFYSFGKKGFDSIKRRKFNIVKSDFEVFDNLNFDYALEITKSIMKDFISGKYDKVEVIYNSFKNAGTQILTREQVMPVVMPEEGTVSGGYVYEPSFSGVLDKLVPRALTMQIYKAILDSYASEHGARMTAMHKATDNAAELIRQLTLSYNKARQSAITNEILEIVGGAEALKG
ncbi:MAG: ATP synthase F1 subunit gamma [Bacteroidales bacterium]|nr:ATP synthase F1 subunit gamma [Bacteroidales bacterium]